MNTRFEQIVPLLTPYDELGGVDTRAMAAHAALLAERGVDGFFVAGTAGEGALLADDEVVEATRTVASAAPGLQVIAQAGRPSTVATRELTLRAFDAGAVAVAVVTPYYYALTADGAIEHYRQVVEAVAGAPVHAYVIPSHAQNDLDPELLARLADLGVAGVKDSTKDLDRHRAYLRVAAGRPGFAVYNGTDAQALFALREGSRGVVPALGNLKPELFVEMFAAAEEGDDARATALQEEIGRLREEVRGQGVASLKHAVAELLAGRGERYGTRARDPLPRHVATDG